METYINMEQDEKSWTRISEFRDFNSFFYLFHSDKEDAEGNTQKVSVNDPRQGKIKNSWLATSMSVVAWQESDRIKKIIKNQRKAANGVYAVELY